MGRSKRIGLFAGPLLFILVLLIPAPSGFSPEAWRVLAVAIFMLSWWVTEAVSLSVTALLPIVLLPFLQVKPIAEASAPYASPIVFLFMGGFMIALAMERWNLHRRIALNIVRITGTNANGIILGFMLATAALSMWISNTATTVMMLPIALSVIGLLRKTGTADVSDVRMRNFALSMMLGIAYAANIGGTATIIGTPPNVVFAGIMSKEFGVEVTFARWMILGLPFAGLMLAITYFFLVRILHPNRLGAFEGAQEIIQEEVDELGPITTGEKRTLAVFITTALLWIFRANLVKLLPFLSLSDAGIAMLATVVLFVVPVDWHRGIFVLKWSDTEKLPWGILLLFGGGLSLAGALSDTGIIDMIGDSFSGVDRASFLIILGLTAVSLYLTEIMSNVALVTIFLPVVGAIALGTGIDLLQVAIPVTLASSCAFMLPMSTPPNAIVFASGYITVPNMVRAGFILNIIAIALTAVVAKWVIPLIFA